eukprot:4834017-Alexandrium_andersonii.AAC.1
MSASLVGSEMCIRDRYPHLLHPPHFTGRSLSIEEPAHAVTGASAMPLKGCLLYTSDAADDM